MKTVFFYFDFYSPYAYLAHREIARVARANTFDIEYCPFDMQRAKLESGNTGPPTVAIPNKLAFAQQDFKRWAARYQIPFAIVGGFEGFRDLNVGTLFAQRHGVAREYVTTIFTYLWGQGGRPDDVEYVARAVSELGMDPAQFIRFIASDEAADAYEQIFQRSAADKVFGAPTFVIDGQLWWGNDRLFMVEDHMAEQNDVAGRVRPQFA